MQEEQQKEVDDNNEMEPEEDNNTNNDGPEDDDAPAFNQPFTNATTRAMIVKDRPDLLITDQTEPNQSEQCWIFQVVREKEAVPFLGPFLGDPMARTPLFG